MRTTSLTLFCLLLLLSPANAVQYRLTFDAAWSASTHPDAYPGPSAHFSPLAGTLHNDSVSFWKPGGTSTAGLERLAELGIASQFIDELEVEIDAGNAFQVIRGRNLDSPGVETHTFEAVPGMSHITLATMIAPSPDWFVGLSGFDLMENGQWRDSFEIELIPWDAGTEGGNRLTLSNPATDPLEPIRRLDTDESSLLFEAATFATFRFERIATCDFNLDGECNLTDLSSSTGLYSVGDLVEGVDAVLGETTKFDITEDGRVDSADLDQWLADAADHNGFAEPYLRGDTNLNDHVGFGDFIALANGFNQGREWSDGNYDGSLSPTSFTDFLDLARNFGEAIARKPAAAQSVPESSTPLLSMATMWLVLSIVSRRHRHGR